MTSMRPVQPIRRFRHVRAPLAACLVAGLVFTVAQAAPAVSTVFAFNGSAPNGGLVLGADGGLYGTSSAATAVSGGLVYRSTVNGSSVTSLHQFSTTEGYAPKAGLLKGSDGLLYGSTRLGDASVVNSTGTIYRMAVDGTAFVILHRFGIYSETNVNGNPVNGDGAYPESALIEGSDGDFYGVTRAGGANGTGVIFRLSRDGTVFTKLHDFGPVTSLATDSLIKNVGGASPIGTLVEAGGYIWGTAAEGGAFGRGTIFRMTLDGGVFEWVHEFTDVSASSPYTNTDGASPLAGLTVGGDGFIYGTAAIGGAHGVGTLYSVELASKAFTVLHDFDSKEGATPSGALVVGLDSRLYGPTSGGGTDSGGSETNFGTIFAIERSGANPSAANFAKLYSFDGKDGSAPYGPLLQLDSATFVGIAAAGGKCSQGTLFQLSTTGATVAGDTTCGQKKNSSGGGAVAPGLLLLFGALGLARRRRRD
jgi:uncharacterized repeat protein (TIGR03803 family)